MDKVDKKTIDLLAKTIKKYADAYHNGKALIPDGDYDRLVDTLRKWSPKHPLLKQVGAPTRAGRKVTLPHFMGSLSKIKADGSAKDWIREQQSSVTVTDKLDGVSAMVVKDKGKLRMFTRGDGHTGSDITLLMKKMKGIGQLPTGLVLRGEVVIPHKSFKGKLAAQFSNPRNLASGIVNSVKIHPNASVLEYVIHTIVSPKNASLAKFRPKLIKAGWKVVPTSVETKPTEKKLQKLLDKRRKASRYLMDGLVLTSKNGQSAAFKGQDESSVATVKEVVWSISRHGLLKPVVHFAKPLNLAGVKVSKATGHNARFIVTNGIGPGAKVIVKRSNEVIPRVMETVQRAEPGLPKVGYEWNENRVEFVAKEASLDSKFVIEKLINALKVLGVKGAKAGLLAKLVDQGIDNVPALLNSSANTFLKAGLGPKQSATLAEDIRSALSNINRASLMAASGSFPAGWGRRRLTSLLDSLPYGKIVALSMNSDALMEAITEVPGFSTSTAKQFVEGFPPYLQFQNNINVPINIVDKVTKKASGPLSGYNVVFTGIRDKKLEDVIASKGGKIGSSVSAKTKYLVTPDPKKTTVKSTAAKKLGIQIVSPARLNKILKST